MRLASAISKVFDAKWSFLGTQSWQPCPGEQVVPPASILVIDCLLFHGNQFTRFLTHKTASFYYPFHQIEFCLGVSRSPDGDGWMGKGAEERRKEGEGQNWSRALEDYIEEGVSAEEPWWG